MANFIKGLVLSLSLAGQVAFAADRADEYAPITRLTDNYQVNDRKQNYDAFKFPLSINTNQEVEGNKVYLDYGHKNSKFNASRLQFKRHFEGIVAQLGGEIVYSGQSEAYHYGVTFRFPRNGRVVWALAATNNREDIYYYKLWVIETNEAWGGAPVPAAAPKPAPVAEPVPVPAPATAPQAAQPDPAPAPAAEPQVDPVALLFKAAGGYLALEYTLDTLQYTGCSVALAKSGVDADFPKAKRKFLSAFPKEHRKALEQELFLEDGSFKDARGHLERSLFQAVEQAKAHPQSARVCSALVTDLTDARDKLRQLYKRVLTLLRR